MHQVVTRFVQHIASILTNIARGPLQAPLLMVAIAYVPGVAFAQTDAPKNVSALVYSSTAVELFWTPSNGHNVEIKRNGEWLGELNSRSLFQTGLSQEQNYHFELRSVASDGLRSEPVIVSLTTRGFQLPVKRVYPHTDGSNALSAAPPPPESVTQADTAIDSVATNVAALTQLDTSQHTQGCQVYSLDDLSKCIQNAGSQSDISILSDLHCSGTQCCPSGRALLKLHQVHNLKIWGNGKRLLRNAGHRQCSLVDIEHSSSIVFNNWQLDDNKAVGGCQTRDKCPRMLHIKRSESIELNNMHISHGKGYTVYVQQVNGFKFINSSLINSGVLGLYIGHSDKASSAVQVRNSLFADNQTNGLALLGVTASSLDANVVEGNVFIRNHRKGQWPVRPQYGTGFTGGGQLYIAQADQLTVRNNEVFDGYCENCFVQKKARSGASGIELGIPEKHSVRNTVIEGNVVINHDGNGIGQNRDSTLDNSVRIQNNRLLNNTTGEHLSGGQVSNNVVSNTQIFESFESSDSVHAQFEAYGSCPGAQVKRVCDGSGRFGQCYASLNINGAQCDNPVVSLSSKRLRLFAGNTISASGWFSGQHGEWCIDFEDVSGNVLSSNCTSLVSAQPSDVQAFVGLPYLEHQAPENTHSARIRIRHSQPNAQVGLDDLKWSIR